MDTEPNLQWDNEALEQLVKRIIQTGETTKVDFKRQVYISGVDHNAELLKDISAIANTYEYAYRNHGFLIPGVSAGLLSFTAFTQTADALQATIDSLVKSYIEPFVPTHLRIVGSGGSLGVLVIPPTRTAPHVFVKDLHKRSKP